MMRQPGIYTRTPQSNVPRYPEYANYVQHLSGGYPDTNFEYPFELNVPTFAQRHRVPQVYLKPKPSSFYDWNTSFTHKVAQYPPYIYWYPNPLDCEDTCPWEVCQQYREAMNDWRNCRRCQLKSPAQCWSPRLKKCVDCRAEKALTSCDLQFGCANPNGPTHLPGRPVNPKYTGCQFCR